MDKNTISEILNQIGVLLELRGENPFKARAFYNASRTILGVSGDIKTMIENGEIRKIKGIGESIAKEIIGLVTTEKSQAYEELKSSFPEGIFKILQIQGLGPKRVRILHQKLNITSVEELEQACKEGKLETLDGFGKKTEENILAGISQLQKHSSKFHCSTAEESAQKIIEVISHQKGVTRLEIGGSLRRKKEIIGDIDIVVSAKKSEIKKIMHAFTTHSEVERITGEGETKSSVVLKNGINCDLRVVDDAEFPFALNYFTGSKEHNVRMRSLARKLGLSLNEYGFSKIESEEKRGKAKKEIVCKTEEDIYKALGLQYVPPELREDMGEIEAAEKNAIPKLLEESEIRGTFHCHSTYSDGVNTLEEMANAAIALGWEYLGIADHSKSAAYARGMNEEQVKKQQKEIEQLNKKWKNFRIFKGIEVDILPNGNLDFSDAVLSSFDFVVASIHSSFKMSEADMTKRITKALKNKYVTMLAHPTGRLLLQREGYAVNMHTVIDVAADNGKMIEINAHPYRLDLDWRLCKYAKEKNILIPINPDAHNIDGLKDVHYGVGIARKGWLEKKDVFNTRSLKEIEKYLLK